MTAPRLRRVRSSALSAIGYLPLAPALRAQAPRQGFIFVRFRGGSTFAYLAPVTVYATLRRSDVSVGRAYNRLLRGLPAVRVA